MYYYYLNLDWFCGIFLGGETQGLNVAAAAYLKNFTRRNIESENASFQVTNEFKDQLIQALLRVQPSVLKILVEVVRILSY